MSGFVYECCGFVDGCRLAWVHDGQGERVRYDTICDDYDEDELRVIGRSFLVRSVCWRRVAGSGVDSGLIGMRCTGVYLALLVLYTYTAPRTAPDHQSCIRAHASGASTYILSFRQIAAQSTYQG